MIATRVVEAHPTGLSVLMAVLPGPDRRRTAQLYQYRVRYRASQPGTPGCVASWDVFGGRLPYQIALERSDAGELRWHCTCADAVYRGEEDHRHVCKHVRGLTAFVPPAGEKMAG
jgi:hypothetical protein